MIDGFSVSRYGVSGYRRTQESGDDVSVKDTKANTAQSWLSLAMKQTLLCDVQHSLVCAHDASYTL